MQTVSGRGEVCRSCGNHHACRAGNCHSAELKASFHNFLLLTLLLDRSSLYVHYNRVHMKSKQYFSRPFNLSLPSAEGLSSADTAVRRWRRDVRPRRACTLAAFGGGDAVPTARGKRGKGHRMVPFPPLDSPKPSFKPLSGAFAAKRGLRGLGSVRRFAYGKYNCPEVTLRELPRITVRGQTVQGVCSAAANGSTSIKRSALEHRTHLEAPRI